MDTRSNASPAPKATRREWIGLAVIALPCLLYSMDLTVLNLALTIATVVLLQRVRTNTGLEQPPDKERAERVAATLED